MYGHSGAVHEPIFFCDRVSRIGSKSLIRNPDFSLPRVGAEVGQGVGEGEGLQACSAAMMLNSAPSFLSQSLIRNPDFSLPRVGAEVGQGVGEGEGLQACSAAMMLNSAPSFLSQRRDACLARHRSLHYSGDVPWSCLIKNPGF